MLKRIFSVLLVFGISHAVLCSAQLCTTTHTTDLYCLLPAAFRTPAQPFGAFYTPFGTELSQLPTAKPAGSGLSGRTWSACSGERNIRRHILRAG